MSGYIVPMFCMALFV